MDGLAGEGTTPAHTVYAFGVVDFFVVCVLLLTNVVQFLGGQSSVAKGHGGDGAQDCNAQELVLERTEKAKLHFAKSQVTTVVMHYF